MKYLVKFFVITFFLFIGTSLYADQKILIIDMKKVMNESKAGQLAQKYLTNTHNSNIKEFKKIEEDLRKEETDLLNKKNILKKEEYKAKTDSLRTKVNEYQLERRSKLEKLNLQRSEARQKLLKAIQPILAKYSNEHNVSLILDKKNIVAGKIENDITQIIIKQLNKELPSIDLN